MNERCFLLMAVIGMACSAGRATVADIVCTSDGCWSAIYTCDSLDTLSMRGYQHDVPGWMHGTIYTDTAEDPTISIYDTLDNDTTFAGTGYRLNVSMNQTFTISSPFVTNVNWTVVITQQPIFDN
jgi:hypothetical protein